MNKKVKAQITVYAALSVFLVITLICTCIRSAAVSAGRVRVEMASVLSMEAVFAGYSSELLEEFDIFALQESEQLQSVFLQYLKKNTQTAAGQENVQLGSRTRVTAGSLDSFTYMTDDGGECINQEILSYMKYGVYNIPQEKILQQQELEKQKKQSEALNEITQEIGKCEETFCEQEEAVLGIIERTGQISVDNALQYVSDVKEDIDLYEEVSDEEEPQDVQVFYKRNRTALNNELEEIQEKIQAALEQTEVYENQREKVQKQAEFCKSKAEQKKEQFSDDLYNGLMQDIDSFIRNDDRNGQCDIEAVKNALYADKEGIETVREQMHGLPKELTQENSMQAEEVLYNLEECLPDLNGEELVSQYSAINVPQNAEGLKSVRNVFKQLKSTMVERITGQQVSDKEITYENLADTLYQRGAQKKSESISNKVLYNEYLFMEFASYTDYLKEDKTLETQTQKQLDYMLEYILYGKTSDKENLQQGMTELSLMREGVNMAYLLTDSEKKAEAYAVATSLVGFTGNMAAVKAAQYVILGVWAYGESIVELKQLYRGGNIEPVKTRQNWKLSLQELLSVDLNQEYSDEKGLSYEEYLKMLFLLQNEQKKYYRTMSAMEIRMIELGNTDFRLKNYIYGAQSRAAFKIGTIPHSYEKTCSYHYG